MSGDFQLDRYLARIGFKGAARPDLGTLTAIHAAQVDAIPFEGLDPLLGRPVKLDLASVQAKLVNSRRGGYCHEQNVLLKAALEAIGFKVTSHGGRVRWMSPPGSPLGPREHTLLKVDLPEGAYLADAGFGACLLDRPLRLEADTEAAFEAARASLAPLAGAPVCVATPERAWAFSRVKPPTSTLIACCKS